MKNTVIVICGPTASGKTGLSIELSKILGGEIISADSLAIYKDLDIGTAKPTKLEQSQVKHHMIDVVDKFDSFSVSQYSEKALPIINDLLACGKVPVICGGTGFYVNSLLFDLSYGNCAKDDAVRLKYTRLYEQYGVDYLYDLLLSVDPDACLKIHKNDVKRVIRALEIYELTGLKKSQINDDLKPRFNYFAFSYDFDRALLYERINKRVDEMFSLGLVEEVKKLRDDGLDLSYQSMQAIGYKEFFEFSPMDENIDKIRELIKKNSRNYAKRQITFFKKLPNLKYIEHETYLSDAHKIIGYVNEQSRN